MKNILKYIIVFIIVIIAFNCLLLLSSSFPSSIIEENVKKSAKIFLKEGNLPLISQYSYAVNDNFTDAIMVNACYSIDNTDPIFSYMSARKNYKKGLTKQELEDTNRELISCTPNGIDSEKYDTVTELDDFVNSDITISIEYARYWHGYIVFLRPLLIFFDIQGIRYLLLITFTILFTIFTILAWKKIGKICTIIMCFSLIAYDYFFIGFSLGNTPIFMVMMIASIILLIRIEKIKNIYLYLFVIGCISNFVDFLTVPTMTLCMPLFIYILYKQRNNQITFKESIKTVLFASIIWLLGYGITWITKWVLYDIIFSKGLINSAIAQVIYRSVTIENISEAVIMIPILNLIMCNMSFFTMFTMLFGFSMIIVPIKKYRLEFNINKEFFKEITPIVMITLIPIIWYLVLFNHTILHTYFVYRHMIIVLIGELICVEKTFTIKKLKKQEK